MADRHSPGPNGGRHCGRNAYRRNAVLRRARLHFCLRGVSRQRQRGGRVAGCPGRGRAAPGGHRMAGAARKGGGVVSSSGRSPGTMAVSRAARWTRGRLAGCASPGTRPAGGRGAFRGDAPSGRARECPPGRSQESGAALRASRPSARRREVVRSALTRRRAGSCPSNLPPIWPSDPARGTGRSR